jgi:hypothetical protein
MNAALRFRDPDPTWFCLGDAMVGPTLSRPSWRDGLLLSSWEHRGGRREKPQKGNPRTFRCSLPQYGGIQRLDEILKPAPGRQGCTSVAPCRGQRAKWAGLKRQIPQKQAGWPMGNRTSCGASIRSAPYLGRIDDSLDSRAHAAWSNYLTANRGEVSRLHPVLLHWYLRQLRRYTSVTSPWKGFPYG